MNELAPQTNEKQSSTEISRFPILEKSADLFNNEFAGDINGAVIAIQKRSGIIITGDWWKKEVGPANNDIDTANRFDIAIQKESDARHMAENGYSSEQIAAIQSHEDYAIGPNDTRTQVNGINLPPEIALDSEVDPEQWAAEEMERRKNYVFNQAKYHLNREFKIGNRTFKVDGIYYGAADSGTVGEYKTNAVDLIDTETNTFISQIEPEKIDRMVSAGEVDPTVKQIQLSGLEVSEEPYAPYEAIDDNSEAESDEKVQERMERASESDEALPLAALELYARRVSPPSSDADDNQEDEPDEEPTIEAINPNLIAIPNLDEYEASLIDEFKDEFGNDSELLEPFKQDVASYITSIHMLQEQRQERIDKATREAYDQAA